jgi:hypothetical protein
MRYMWQKVLIKRKESMPFFDSSSVRQLEGGFNFVPLPSAIAYEELELTEKLDAQIISNSPYEMTAEEYLYQKDKL